MPLSERDVAWWTVRGAAETLEQAKKDYDAAIVHAREVGHSNAAIARAARLTEAAIRMRFNRKKKR